MAKISREKATQMTEKRVYFQGEYSFNKVAGLKKIGDRRYAIFLRPEDNLYSTYVHDVKPRNGKGFQGKFSTVVKCKSYDENGDRLPETAECCELFDEEKTKHPEKEDSSKRMISYAKPIFDVPVMILGSNITDPNTPAYPVTKVKGTSGYEPAYLEFQKSTWTNDIQAALIKKLKDDDIIPFNLEGEELVDIFYEHLSKVIVEINAVAPKAGSVAKFVRTYSFIPFTDLKIAKETGEREQIINWETDPAMAEFRKDAEAFLNLLEQKEKELSVDWKPGALMKFMHDGAEREQNLEAFNKANEPDPELIKPETKVKKVEAPVREELVPPTSVVEEVNFNIDELDGYDPDLEEFLDEED